MQLDSKSATLAGFDLRVAPRLILMKNEVPTIDWPLVNKRLLADIVRR